MDLQKREIISATENFTKKDLLNSRNGFSLQDLENGATIRAIRCAVVLGQDEDGSDKEVAVIISDDGVIYTSISSTIIDSIIDTIGIIDEEGTQELKLFKRKSKAGREFLTLSIL